MDRPDREKRRKEGGKIVTIVTGQRNELMRINQ